MINPRLEIGWMELDFHGKTWQEALAEFHNAYNTALSRRGQQVKIRVIHGYGSTGVGGVLRERLRKYFQQNKSKLLFTPGELLDRNPGWTLIVALKPLPLRPDPDERLEDLILKYCQEPKTRTKIDTKFYRFGKTKVDQALRSLITPPSLLIKSHKSGRDAYQSIE